MKLDNTPLRNLVKQYANGLIDREQYLRIRSQLLQRLEEQGTLKDQDLDRLIAGKDDPPLGPRSHSRYSRSDWIIILLGLAAAIALGAILYS